MESRRHRHAPQERSRCSCGAELDRLQKVFWVRLKNMRRLPDVVILVDPAAANPTDGSELPQARLSPWLSMLDTNWRSRSSPTWPIPCNDDAVRSVSARARSPRRRDQ